MAEDDQDDRLLIRDAVEEAGLGTDIKFLSDGVELLDYLHRRGPFQPVGAAPQPDFILLDLKMPRKNGWEALKEIQADPAIRSIPVFILTTSTDEEDRSRAISLGADGYFTKQVTFDGLINVIKEIGKIWEQGSRGVGE
jgi:two-component system response regulator